MPTINLEPIKSDSVTDAEKTRKIYERNLNIGILARDGVKNAEESGITDAKQLEKISQNIEKIETYKYLTSGEFAIAELDANLLLKVCDVLHEGGLPSSLSAEDEKAYSLVLQEVVKESTKRVNDYMTVRNLGLSEEQKRDSFLLFEQLNESEKKLIANTKQYSLEEVNNLGFLATRLRNLYSQDDFLGKDEKMSERLDAFSNSLYLDYGMRRNLATLNKDRINSLAIQEAVAAKKAKLEEKGFQKARKKITNWLYSQPTETPDNVYNRVYQESFKKEFSAILINPDYDARNETNIQLAETIDFMKNEPKGMNAEQQIAYNKTRDAILAQANYNIDRYMRYRNAELSEDFITPVENRSEEYNAKVLQNINHYETPDIDETAALAKSLDTYYTNSPEHARMEIIKQKIIGDLYARIKADEAQKNKEVIMMFEDVNHSELSLSEIRRAGEKAKKEADPDDKDPEKGKIAENRARQLAFFESLRKPGFDYNSLPLESLRWALADLKEELPYDFKDKAEFYMVVNELANGAEKRVMDYLEVRNAGLGTDGKAEGTTDFVLPEQQSNQYKAQLLENISQYTREDLKHLKGIAYYVQVIHQDDRFLNKDVAKSLDTYYTNSPEHARMEIIKQKIIGDLYARIKADSEAKEAKETINKPENTSSMESSINLDSVTISQENAPSLQPENVLSTEAPIEGIVENVVVEEAAPVEIGQENVLSVHNESVEEVTDNREALLAMIQQLQDPEFNFEEISNERLSELYQDIYKAEKIKLSFTAEQQLGYYNVLANMANASGTILDDYMKKRNDGLMVDGVQEKIDTPYKPERSPEYNDKIFENTKKEYRADDMVTIANLAAFTKDASEILMMDDAAKYYDNLLSKIQADAEYRVTLEQINEIAMFASLDELRVVNGEVADGASAYTILHKVNEGYKERYKHDLTNKDTKRIINNVNRLVEKSKQKGFPEELIDILAESPDGKKLNFQEVLEAYGKGIKIFDQIFDESQEFVKQYQEANPELGIDSEVYGLPTVAKSLIWKDKRDEEENTSQGTVFSVDDNNVESQGTVFDIVEENEANHQTKKPTVDAKPLNDNTPLPVPAPATPLVLPISEFKPMKDEAEYKQGIRDAIKDVAEKNKIALKEVPDEQNPKWMVLETFYSPKAIETGEKDGQIIYKGNNENGQSQVSTTNDFATILLAVKTAEKMGKTPIIFGKTNKKHSINLVLASALVGAKTKNAPDLESLKDNPQIALLIEKRALRKELHELRTKLAETADATKKQEIQEKIEAKVQDGLKLQKEKGSIDVRKAKETPEQRMKNIKGRLEKAKGKDASDRMVKTERLKNFVNLNTTTR